MTQLWVLVAFHVVILVILAIDLGVFRRKAQTVSTKEAGLWYSLWFTLAIVFGVGVWWFKEPTPGTPEPGAAFLLGYLLELSLSVDNLFVFLVIFRYFAVPEALRFRVLFWGIVGALIMRATFILAGAALLAAFHWMMYVFGLFLMFTGFKLLRTGEEEIDPGRNPVLRLARRLFRVVPTYDSPNFFLRIDGRWYATSLFLVLLVIESTDVVFALDSIPAIFGITDDIFIVYTSNIFAILGLRSLYFLLANFLGMFRYLHVGLAVVLIFIGIKMVIKDPVETVGWPGFDMPIYIALPGIAIILALAIAVSLIAGPKKHLGHPPEVVLDPEAKPAPKDDKVTG